MNETSRFLSPENRREHHIDLIEDLIRQTGGAVLMSKLFDSHDLLDHMSTRDIKMAFSNGLCSGRFDFEQLGGDDAAVILVEA